ncbi:YqaA family protein [Chloroflexota bacterium]
MTIADSTKNCMPEQRSHVYWPRLVITVVGAIAFSFGLAYLLQNLLTKYDFPLYKFEWLAYSVIFGILLVTNLSILVPVPLVIPIMIAAATRWDPVLIALFGSMGGAIGEISGYYAGYLGKKVAIPGEATWYKRVEHWIQRWGLWAIFLVSLQPIIPFDIGGFIAGAARMPVYKFLPAVWLGKFLRYAVVIYVGVGLIHFMPFFLW